MQYLNKLDEKNFDYKIELKKTPLEIDFDNFRGHEFGRFNVTYDNDVFECFSTTSVTKRLFVFFSAAGRKNTNTIFHRISWSKKLNGICLYIEDPMYKKIPGLSAGWYFGDEKNSYLLKIVDIVNKIAKFNEISENNIIFTGSSSAGYAALYCANIIKGSISYAYNPQIYLTRSPSYPNFLKYTNLNLEIIEDKFNRTDINYISKNTKSKFIIFYNNRSIYDQKHFESWLQELNLDSTPGLKVHNGINFLIADIDNSNPHTCMGEIDDFVQSLVAINLDYSLKVDLINSSLSRFKNYSNMIEDIFYNELWSNLLNNNLPNNISISRAFKAKENFIDFKVDDYPEIFVYRITYLRLKESGEFVFYIKKNNISFTESFFKEVTDICLNLNLNLNKYENFIRIHKNFTGKENIHIKMMNFFEITFEKFTLLYNSKK